MPDGGDHQNHEARNTQNETEPWVQLLISSSIEILRDAFSTLLPSAIVLGQGALGKNNAANGSDGAANVGSSGDQWRHHVSRCPLHKSERPSVVPITEFRKSDRHNDPPLFSI